MPIKLINTDKLTAIADAIRGKTGSTDIYSVDGMVDAISNISGGGGDTSIEDGLVERTLTEYSNDRVTKIGDFVFRACSSLTTVNLPSAMSIGEHAFRNCYWLTTVSLPVATDIGNYVFSDCSSLAIVDSPLATKVYANAFRNCYSLTALILRNTTQVCALLDTSAFTNCCHYHGTVNAAYDPSGLKDGYIYVPASLIDSYKLATQFRALEDFTVDGTVTGELDESKI